MTVYDIPRFVFNTGIWQWGLGFTAQADIEGLLYGEYEKSPAWLQIPCVCTLAVMVF